MVAGAWSALIALCLLMYITLDGYDLGIGILLLGERDVRRRREMVEIVATAWDGNESWIILLGVAMWGGLPAAYGGLLPAVYLPLVVMLFALIFRGVAIEMISAATGVPRGWGYAFGIGSVVATFAQGLIIGGWISGVTLRDGVFVGGAFDFLTPYSVLTGVTTLLLYGVAGAAVLQFKSEGELRRRSATIGRALAGFCAVFVLVCALSLGATAVPPRLDSPGRAATFGVMCALAVVGLVLIWHGFGRVPDRRPVVGVVLAEVAGVAALIVAVYPTVVPPSLTMTEAQAPVGTLNFLLIGVGVNIPLVLFYNWYAHHVFRGKYRVPPDLPAGVSQASAALSPDPPGPAGSAGGSGSVAEARS